MVPVARITHNIKGRLRIKIPLRKGDRDYFSSLAGELVKIPGIARVEINPLTGSILVLHETELEKIIDHANENGLFRILLDDMKNANSNNNSKGTNRRITSRISDVFKQADSKMLDISGGQLDIGGSAFIALAGFGIYQIYRGNLIALPWYAAFWYALNIFLKSLPEPALEISTA